MLNLSDVQSQVKSRPAPRPNVRGGNPLAINAAYRELKALGWTSTMTVHPTDRTPTFTLGDCTIWRDQSGEFEWRLETPAGLLGVDGDLATITDEARSHQPQAEHPADIVAADIRAEYGDFSGRLDRAVEMVKDGAGLSEYDTRWLPYGYMGRYECDCPDNTYRPQRAAFGAACKHTLALMIKRTLAGDAERTNAREFSEEMARKAEMWEASNPDPDVGLRETALPYDYGEGTSLDDWLGTDEISF